MPPPWDLKARLLERIRTRGGWVNCHCHLDKAFLISEDRLADGSIAMEAKWELFAELKRGYTADDLRRRMSLGLDRMIAQGVSVCCTQIDVDEIIGLTALDVALELRAAYAGRIELLVVAHPLQGLASGSNLAIFEAACERADIVGGLPSRDRPDAAGHLDQVLGLAKRLGKPVQAHVDQENNPREEDSLLLAEKTLEHGLEGRVTAVHAISVAALDADRREATLELFRRARIGVVVCPGAALSMQQLDAVAPLHNSIAPVPRLLELGIPVGLGTDNIYDFFMPLTTGDLWEELVQLANACRFYELDALAEIAADGGRAVLGLGAGSGRAVPEALRS